MSITARSLQCRAGCRQLLRQKLSRNLWRIERSVPSLLAMSQADKKSEGEKRPFVSDLKEIRRRAREHILNGAVTDGYRGDRETVIRVLNEALATEIVCVLRYRRHYFMASGIHATAVADEFLEHSKEEQGHADSIAERITQLDGEPDLNPANLLTRSHAEYVEGNSLIEMLREDLIAERIAIDSYGEIIRYLGDTDPTSRRLMESILAVEEEHAEDLKTLLESVGDSNKKS
jgi:bacterioferritin